MNEPVTDDRFGGEQEPLGCFPYVIGGASFIPLLGVPIGLIVIIWGIVKRKAGGLKLALVGTCGILFTFILYGTLFYKGFVEKGGIYDDLRGKMAQTQLNDLIKKIEFYRIDNGKYPDHLAELISEDPSAQDFTFVHDPFVGLDDLKPKTYSYGLMNDGKNYYIYSAGSDRISGTEDDIYPDVSEKQMERIGYRKNRSEPVDGINSVTPQSGSTP